MDTTTLIALQMFLPAPLLQWYVLWKYGNLQKNYIINKSCEVIHNKFMRLVFNIWHIKLLFKLFWPYGKNRMLKASPPLFLFILCGLKIQFGYRGYLKYQTLTIEISAEELQRNQYSTSVEEERLAFGN